jgi:hypothetical protein
MSGNAASRCTDSSEPEANAWDGDGANALASWPALARAGLALLLAGGQERALAEALWPVLVDFDAALLDCPPSLGLLTLAALVAADEALVPADPNGPGAHELAPPAGGARSAAGRPADAAPDDDWGGGHAGEREGEGDDDAAGEPRAPCGRPPELLGELPLAVEAARDAGAAAIAARLRSAPQDGAPSRA